MENFTAGVAVPSDPVDEIELISSTVLWIACAIVIVVIFIFSVCIGKEHVKHIKWKQKNTTEVLDYRSYFEKADRRGSSYFSTPSPKSTFISREREKDSKASPVFSPADTTNMYPLLRRIFSQFDENKDGYIDAEELTRGLDAMAGNPVMTVPRAKAQINNFNTTGRDGLLGPTDFIRWSLMRLRTSKRQPLSAEKNHLLQAGERNGSQIGYDQPDEPLIDLFPQEDPSVAVTSECNAIIEDVVLGVVQINSDYEDDDSIGDDPNIIDPRLLRYADRQNAMQVVKEKREEKLERPIYESQMNAFMEGLGVGLDDEDNSDYEDDQFTSGWDLYKEDKELSPSTPDESSGFL